MTDTPDPSAFFRQMLGQWEQFTNDVGGDMLKTGEFARTMHGATAATMQAQEALKGVMERWLAAANMPSREEIADLSARLARVEATLERIETAITLLGNGALAGGSETRDDRHRPKRTRTPPA